MRTSSIAASMAAASLLFLSACGGGGGSGSSETPSEAPPQPTVASVQAADPARTHTAARRVADNLPAFGSVTQSSNGGSVSGITSDAASASFDGRDLGVTVRREDGSGIRLSTASHSLGTISIESGIPGHDRGRGDVLLDVAGNRASAAIAYASWNDSDPADYLAGGYWMYFEGDFAAGNLTGAEVGAFVDGPEIDGPADLPLAGTATYRGPTEGLFAQTWGTDDPEAAPGSTMIGAYAAIVDLTADFGANTISGCVGCTGSVELSGLFEDGRTGVVTEEVGTSDSVLRLGPASIEPDGSFRNRRVSLSNPNFTVAGSSGSWGGKFSNRQEAIGDPRLVAGTYGGKAETSGGTETTFVGAYYANKR